MIGGEGLATLLGAAPPADADTATLRKYVHALADAGLAVLFCVPGSKLPAEPRTARQVSEADKAYRESEQTAGRRVTARTKAPAGLHLATTDKKLLDAYVWKLRGPQSMGGFTADPDLSQPVPGSTDKDADARTAAAEAGKPRKLTAAEGKAVANASTVPLNLAIEVGRSRVVVVDCDTAEQVDRFLVDFTGGADSGVMPTVRTPGQRDAATGEWVHSGGGHYWFTVASDTVLPEDMSGFVSDGDSPQQRYAVSWRDRYVLIPPSVRPEGVYVAVGREYPIESTGLLAEIRRRAAVRRERAQAAADRVPDGDLDDRVTAWAGARSWASILVPLGWFEAGTDSSCGCDIFTAPGSHASPKSATAHDTGCALGRYTVENAPLHVWTDHPGPEIAAHIDATGEKTLTRLRVVALTEFDGDMHAALRGLGLADPNGGLSDEELAQATAAVSVIAEGGGRPWSDIDPSETFAPAPTVPAPTVPAPTVPASLPPVVAEAVVAEARASVALDGETFAVGPVMVGDPEDGDDETPSDDPMVLEASDTFPVTIRPLRDWRHLEPPRWAVEGLIEQGGLVSLIGPPGVGKSNVVLDILGHLATGARWHGKGVIRQRSLYLPGEGMAGAVQRLKAWEDARSADLGEAIMIAENIIPVSASSVVWAQLISYIGRNQIGTVVVDTYARSTTGMDENDAKDTGIAIARLSGLQKATGATVILVHHTTKANASNARGSSALQGAVDCELVIAHGWTEGESDRDVSGAASMDQDAPGLPGKPIELRIGKMKNATDLDSQMHMFLKTHKDSVVVVGKDGQVNADPLNSKAWVPPLPPSPEHTPLLLMRIWDHLQAVSHVGATVTELRDQVSMDEVTRRMASATGAARQWKRRITEALDLGVRSGALGHPAGSSAKWIPVSADAVTAEGTRQALEDFVESCHSARHDPQAVKPVADGTTVG